MDAAAFTRVSESELTTASPVLLKLVHMAVRHELFLQAAVMYCAGVSSASAARSAWTAGM